MEQMRAPPSAGLEVCNGFARGRAQHNLTRACFCIAQDEAGRFNVGPSQAEDFTFAATCEEAEAHGLARVLVI